MDLGQKYHCFLRMTCYDAYEKIIYERDGFTMKRNIFAIALLLVLIMASCALAGPQDFVLVNNTGVDIHAVHIAPSASDNWGDDILGDQILENGQILTVTFAAQKAELWDIRVADEDGDTLDFQEFNLFEISKVTLNNNGEATYE